MSGIWTVISRIWTENMGDSQFLLSIFRTSTFDVRDMDSKKKMMSGIRTVMSGIWTVMSGIWTVMSGIWTRITSDVWQMDNFLCPYSGHQKLMSGTWTVFSVHVPDIKDWCPGHGQFSLSMFRTSNIDVWNKDRYFVHLPDIIVRIPDIIVRIPDITVLIPDITGHIPDINFMRNLMSGIWPVKTGRFPDIKSWCPEYGQ